MKTGNKTEQEAWEAFQSRYTVAENGCWLWDRPHSSGYGYYWNGSRTVRAHRFAYEMTNGPIPAGMYACHKCDTPRCVNPNHIFIGTQKDNLRDCLSKGRNVVTNKVITPALRERIAHLYTPRKYTFQRIADELGFSEGTARRAYWQTKGYL